MTYHDRILRKDLSTVCLWTVKYIHNEQFILTPSGSCATFYDCLTLSHTYSSSPSSKLKECNSLV